MRHLLEPQLVHAAGSEPGLFVDLRDERRALLLDLPDLRTLPPRKLLRVSHVFVSHTHMDHFAGFDELLRVVLGRKPAIVLTGGPGFVDQVGHKLAAYTWNVVQRYAVPLALEVREHRPDGSGRRAVYDSRDGFARSGDEAFAFAGDVLHDEPLLRVRGRFVDHGMPCLAFAVEEKARVRVARDRLAALGLGTGPWLRTVKEGVLAGAPGDTPVVVGWRDAEGDHAQTRTLGELVDVVLDVGPGRRIGYATDLRGTVANLEVLRDLLAGVDQLFIECVFLDADREHWLRKNHLTARQAGCIARALGARDVVPFHVSPRYEGRGGELVAELRAALGTPDGDRQAAPGSRACSREML